jgi:propionyl-CoA carboxylase alpha chain
MNTRLQVEHPVTELVTGLDLVELMIRIAAGEKLPFGQAEVKQTGWAVEARVYAEDPQRSFLPSIGRLTRYRPPADHNGGDGIRIDSGVFEGAEIALYYDPMIAKLIGYGADREAAIDRLGGALDAFYIAGVRHNVPFLAAIAASERFRAGALSTDFIAEMFPDGYAPPPIEADRSAPADRAMLMAAVLAETRLRESEGGTFASELAVRLDGRSYRVSLRLERNGYLIDRDGESCFAATDWRPGNPLLHLRIDDRIATVQIERLPGRAFRLTHRGVIRRAQVLSPRAAELLAMMPEKAPADTSRMVLSPMPGLLTQVVVDEGQEVKAGEPLVVVEAMKMENVLRAERDGKVAKLCAKPGDSLAVDQVILEFE